MTNTVLVVDDSPILRRSIRKSLNQTGVDDSRIMEANHGAEALEILKIHEIALVLLDLNMPVMNGEATLKEIRENTKTKDVPVVIVTTEGNIMRLMRLQSMGIRGYLRKPFQPEDLRELVGDVLNLAS
ncbi:MAG: two-component system chemotaxis response regulator CheY [Planctomycetota bacterium]|jgi:two-component system chemotaxis response regulator CheY